MSVPDHRALVERCYASGVYDLTTKAGAGKFIEAAARDLHAANSNWGHLRKPEGRTHVVDAQGHRHAVDVVLYKASGAIVDIISGAGDPGAKLAWSVGADGEYGEGDWYAPVGGGAPVPITPVTPITPIDPLAPGSEPSAEESDLITLLTYHHQAAMSVLNEILLTVQLQTGGDENNERRYKDLVARVTSLHEMITELPVTFEAKLFGQSITLKGKPR